MGRLGIASCAIALRKGVGRLALLSGLLPILATGCLYPNALDPTPGLYEYRALSLVEVPGGRVDAAGGNLVVRRVDFRIDTLIGTLAVGAVYNSALRRWVWPFQASYDGQIFSDSSGATHDVSDLADGRAIPGTHWRKLDAERISTKGGLVHHFEPGSHRLIRMTWGEQPEPALIFVGESEDGVLRTVAVQQCSDDSCFDVYSIDYDGNGCVSKLSDRAGRQAILASDADCNPVIARDPLDVVKGWPGRRYEYELGQLTAVTNSEGERFEYTYVDGHLMTAYAPQSDDSMTLFIYGFSAGSGLYFTRVVDPRGGPRQLYYDAQGRLHSLRDAAEDVTRFEWSGLRPVEMTDPAAGLTAWQYSDDDPVRITWPNGNVLEIEYQAGGLDRVYPHASARARVSDSVGLIRSNAYDAFGRISQSFNGVLEQTIYWYSEIGQVEAIRNPAGQVTFFREYGEHGHPELLEKPGLLAQRRRFDAVGNLLAGPDFAGPVDPGRPGIVSRGFDADRNLVSLELAGGTDADPLAEQRMELEVEYRSDGRPLRIFRPYGGDTRFDYDAAGRMVARNERVDGVWQTTRYEYAAGGRVSATEWPNGMRHEVDRDEMGHPVALRLMRDSVLEKSMVSTWASGRLVSRTDSQRPGLESISYDAAGRISAIQFPEGEHLEFQRDLRGREVGRVYRLQAGAEPLRTLSHSYDGADRLVEWRDQGETILERTYQGGLLIEEVSGNGLVRSFRYDDDSGLLRDAITQAPDQGWPYLFTTYEWQSCGSLHYCITSSTIGEAGPDSSVPVIDGVESYRLGPISMTDDGLDHAGARVRSWGIVSLPDNGYEGEGEYGFDALGNWLGVWLGETERARFTYNGERNRLLAADLSEPRIYTWDDAGFMLSRDGAPIEWDAGGRPTALGADTGMEWDTLGRLISVRVGGQVSQVLFGGSVQGDAGRNPASLDLRAVEIDLTTGQRTYRHVDQRGNVQFVTDHQGVLVRYYVYSPFGVAEAWGDGTDRRNFALGQEAGDYLWLGDRLYDPEVGRFLSPDPEYALINQFAYTLGNPVFFWDPDGRHAVPSGVVQVALMALDVADRIETLGYTAFAAGLALNVPLVMLGGLMAVVGSLTLRWLIEYGCACVPTVTIEDLPEGYRPEQGGGGGAMSKPSPGVDVSSCSPQVLEHERRGLHGGWLWLPLQLLLAAALLRARKRRNGGD